MFRKKKSRVLQRDVNFGNCLEDMNLQITNDFYLRKLNAPNELYEFQVTKDKEYNEKSYFAVLDHVYSWTLQNSLLTRISIPLESSPSEPHSWIYATRNWQTNENGIVIIIQSMSHPLIWSNRNLREGDVRRATVLDVIAKCTEKKLSVVIFSPSALLWDQSINFPRVCANLFNDVYQNLDNPLFHLSGTSNH